MPLKKIKTTFEAKDKSSGVINKLSSGVGKLQGRLDKLKNTRLGKLTSSLASAAKGLTGIGALASGGIFAGLITGGLAAGDAIAKTSDKLGIASEKLTELQFAVTQNTTVGIPQFNTALQRMVRRLGTANGETDAFTKKLEAFGFNVKELKQLAPEEQFKAIADRMANMANQQERVALAFAVFDTEGANLVNLLQQGGDAIDTFTDKASRLGFGFDKAELDKIQAANDAIGRIQDVIRGLSISFAIQLAPVIEELANKITVFVENAGGVQKITEAIFTTALGGFTAVKQVAEVLGPIFEVLAIPLGVLLKALSLIAQGILKVLNFFKRTGDEARAAAAEIENLDNVARRLGEGGDTLATDNIDIGALERQRAEKEAEIALLEKDIALREVAAEKESVLQGIRQRKLDKKREELALEKSLVSQIDEVIAAETRRLKNLDGQSVEIVPEINIPEVKIPGLGDLLANSLSGALGSNQGEVDKGPTEAEKLAQQREASLARLKVLRESIDEELRIRNDFRSKLKELDEIEASGVAVIDRAGLEARFAEERDIALSAIDQRKEEELQRELEAENRKTEALLKIKRERDELFGSTNEDIDLNLPDLSANDNDFANQSADTVDKEAQLQEQFYSRLEKLRNAREQQLIIDSEYDQLELQAKATHQQQLGQLEEFSAAKQQENAKKALLNSLGVFGQFSKKAFELQKAARLTEAFLSGRAAVMDAWESGMSVGGPSAPAVAAAYAAAAGLNALAQIRTIKETKFGSKGGSTNSVGSGTPSGSTSGGSSSGSSGGLNTALNSNNQNQQTQPAQRFEFFLNGNRRYDADEIEQIIEGVNERVGAGITLRATVADQAEFAENVA